MSIKKNLLSAACGAFMLIGSVSAMAWDDHNVVITKEHVPVIAVSGDCVRTKEILGGNPCPTLWDTFATVYFKFDSYLLTETAMNTLDKLMNEKLAGDHLRMIRIVGYTDRIGSNSYNQVLSENRARSVQNYLRDHNYTNSAIMYVKGAGKSFTQNCEGPTSAAVIKCLQKDRKVDIMLEIQNMYVHGGWIVDDEGNQYYREAYQGNKVHHKGHKAMHHKGYKKMTHKKVMKEVAPKMEDKKSEPMKEETPKMEEKKY